MQKNAVQTVCAYCGVGCGVNVHSQGDHEFEVSGDPAHPANWGNLCSKGALLADTLSNRNRVYYPTYQGKWLSWKQAITLVASQLKSVRDTYGPESIGFYVSGQLLTEDYYVANKLVKGYLGTSQIDTNSRLCMASTSAAHQAAFGADVVPGVYDDLLHAKLVVVVGSNLEWCHPVLAKKIRERKSCGQNQFPKVVVVDPRTTQTAAQSDLHLKIHSGSDTVLFNGLLNYLSQAQCLDLDYLEKYTEGFAECLATAQKVTIPEVAAQCGLQPATVVQFFQMFADEKKTVTLFAQGINQSCRGTDNALSILNCHLATGRIGKPGMGPFSLTGQGNAMGGREVGGLATQLAAHIPFHQADLVQEYWQSPKISTKPGLKAVDLFEAVHKGKIKAIWIIATNPVVSMPDAKLVQSALRNCPLVIVSDCFKSDTTRYADIVLPAAAWGEKSGMVTNSERCLSRQRAFRQPLADSRPDWWILSKVAQSMGYSGFDFENPYQIFKEYVGLTGYKNEGSRALDLSGLSAMSRQDYENWVSRSWPISQKVNRTIHERFFSKGGFFTESGKARLVPVTPVVPRVRPGLSQDFAKVSLTLNTGRVRDQWHTMTRTGETNRLLRHTKEPKAWMHPKDASRHRVRDQDLIRIKGESDHFVVFKVEVSDAERPGQLFIPMHWCGSFLEKGFVNEVVSSKTDPISGQPEFKHTQVLIEKYQPDLRGFLLVRESLANPGLPYWIKIPEQDCFRYEFAASSPGLEMLDWLSESFAVDLNSKGSVHLNDRTKGVFRFAQFKNSKVHTCGYIGEKELLPELPWMSNLFLKEQLSTKEKIELLSLQN